MQKEGKIKRLISQLCCCFVGANLPIFTDTPILKKRISISQKSQTIAVNSMPIEDSSLEKTNLKFVIDEDGPIVQRHANGKPAHKRIFDEDDQQFHRGEGYLFAPKLTRGSGLSKSRLSTAASWGSVNNLQLENKASHASLSSYVSVPDLSNLISKEALLLPLENQLQIKENSEYKLTPDRIIEQDWTNFPGINPHHRLSIFESSKFLLSPVIQNALPQLKLPVSESKASINPPDSILNLSPIKDDTFRQSIGTVSRPYTLLKSKLEKRASIGESRKPSFSLSRIKKTYSVNWDELHVIPDA